MNILLKSLLVIVPVALLTGGIAFFRAESLAGSAEVSARGLAEVRRSLTTGYTLGALIFGSVCVFVFQWLVGRWPEDGASIFLKLAIGAAVFLTVLAIVMSPSIKRSCVVEWTLMHILWAGGFGWLTPLLIKSLL